MEDDGGNVYGSPSGRQDGAAPSLFSSSSSVLSVAWYQLCLLTTLRVEDSDAGGSYSVYMP